MKALEAGVRGIEMDGLLWGASKLVPVGYGIRKLQITLVVEDEKVSLDDLQEQIQEQEDYVQSTDVVRTPSSVYVETLTAPRPRCKSCSVLLGAWQDGMSPRTVQFCKVGSNYDSGMSS
jgi:translation elongation factor EF-1beta